jgi:Flp pilus assembly pilin Flp
MLPLLVRLQAFLSTTCRPRGRGEDGQTTAEYALVLVGAAAVAVLLLAWATKTNRISRLFDLVMDQIVGRIT